MQRPSFFSSRLANHALAGLIGAAVVLANYWLSRPALATIDIGDYATYQCATGRGQGPTFRVLTLTSIHAMEMADQLCGAGAIRERFAAVAISWRPRGYLTARHILDEHFDYFWNRQHLVAGMVPDYRNYYTPLLDTPTYSLYWMSLRSAPRLTADYFADKTVGFLEDAQSQTYFLQPFKSLKDAALELSAVQQRFYPDLNALYQAFLSGEVDLMTSARGELEKLGVSEYYSLLISDDAVSGSWFLNNRWTNTAVACDLARLRVRDPFFDRPATVTLDDLDCGQRP